MNGLRDKVDIPNESTRPLLIAILPFALHFQFNIPKIVVVATDPTAWLSTLYHKVDAILSTFKDGALLAIDKLVSRTPASSGVTFLSINC